MILLYRKVMAPKGRLKIPVSVQPSYRDVSSPHIRSFFPKIKERPQSKENRNFQGIGKKALKLQYPQK